MKWLEENLAEIAAFTSFMVAQSVGFIIWLTRLDDRVQQIERMGSPNMTMLADRVSRVEEQMKNTNYLLEQNTNRLDRVLDRMNSGA